jgi:hypothetical protein
LLNFLGDFVRHIGKAEACGEGKKGLSLAVALKAGAQDYLVKEHITPARITVSH